MNRPSTFLGMTELESPFAQHFNTNYVPAASEIEEIRQLVDRRHTLLDSIDAEIAELNRRRRVYVQYIDNHNDLISPARRLHTDILSTIFLALLAISGDNEPSHPAVTVSHVCRQWRELALNTPLLWANIDINIPPYPTMISLFFMPLPQIAKEALSAVVWGWKQRIGRLCDRVEAFARRSKACPLQITYTVVDPAGFNSVLDQLDETDDHLGLGVCGGWEDALEPFIKVAEGGNEWRSFHLDIKMCDAGSLLLTLLSAFLKANERTQLQGLQVLEIDLKYFGLEARNDMWQEIFPEGRLDVRAAPLTKLSARMPYSDLERFDFQWDRLTTLSIGSPDKIAIFGPEDATRVLILTPQLIRCTITFAEGMSPSPFDPAGRVIPLHKLESLVMLGSSPPVEFAAILQLPSLTLLSAIQTSTQAQDENGSPIVELVRRYGEKLTNVSFVYTCFTQSALELTLKSLPNVLSLEMLGRDPAAISMRFNPNPGMALPDEPTTTAKFDAALLQKLTPKVNEAGSQLLEECLCPKLQTLVCELGKGHGRDTKKQIADLIEARRARHGPVAWLNKVDVEFKAGPVDTISADLKRRAIDMAGISFKAKYPSEGEVPCSFSLPVAGIGSLDIAMEIGPIGCIHAQRQAGQLF